MLKSNYLPPSFCVHALKLNLRRSNFRKGYSASYSDVEAAADPQR
jgi:hypothetical protein